MPGGNPVLAARGRRARTAPRAGVSSEKLATYLAGSAPAIPDTGNGPAGILADTTAWIDYFRGAESVPGRLLARALGERSVFVCGQVLSELEQGLRGEDDKKAVLAALGSLEYIEMEPKVWIRAGALAAGLRRKGQAVPHSDLLVAALALEHRLQVLTADPHFREIPGVALHEGS